MLNVPFWQQCELQAAMIVLRECCLNRKCRELSKFWWSKGSWDDRSEHPPLTRAFTSSHPCRAAAKEAVFAKSAHRIPNESHDSRIESQKCQHVVTIFDSAKQEAYCPLVRLRTSEEDIELQLSSNASDSQRSLRL